MFIDTNQQARRETIGNQLRAKAIRDTAGAYPPPFGEQLATLVADEEKETIVNSIAPVITRQK
jgi:hypothetical protein